jgi:colanic acid/amylovoran biosynthesis protein
MIVEISGAGFHNMGAELMLAAAVTEMSRWVEVDDVVVDAGIGSHAQRRAVGCRVVVRPFAGRSRYLAGIASQALRVVPASTLRRLGAHKPTSMDALVDASGFAFGDQWGARPSSLKAEAFRFFATSGKPIVLLPQAFGPFQDSEVARAATGALELTSLIFARDQASLEHLHTLQLRAPRVELAPDFTDLLGVEPERFASETVVIIPNARMTQMAATTEDAYLGFLRQTVQAVLHRGYEVIVVSHEPMDQPFVARLESEFGRSITSRSAVSAVDVKAIVGGASLVVSSRFHGLVNALSQAVPAIGTGWSHKYSQLMADYGCQDCLWSVEGAATVDARLGEWLKAASLSARRLALERPAASLKERTRAMWRQTRACLQ